MPRLPIGFILAAKAIFFPVAFGVAGAILDGQGRVLLVRQTYIAGWRLPGGGIGHGEPPEEALRRELLEELGLSGGRTRLFGVYARKLWWSSHVVALYAVEGARLDFRPNREIGAIVWARPDAPPPGTAPATARRLAELAVGAQQAGHW